MRPRYLPWLLALMSVPTAAQGAQHGVPMPRYLGQADALAAAKLVSSFGQVTSIFRTIAHNRAVGGVADSYHLLGRAIDVVRRTGVSHAEIAAALRAAGFHLIESLDEGDHSHFAFGTLHVRLQLSSAKSAPPKLDPLLADQHGVLAIDNGKAGGGRAFGQGRLDQETGR